MALMWWMGQKICLSLGGLASFFIITMSIQFKIEEESEAVLDKREDQQKRVGTYLIGKTVGQGTFNQVRIARHIHTNEKVAVKMIEKRAIATEADEMRLKKELKILRKARHPNIIQLYQILEDKHYYYLVTQLASRGEMFEHIVKNEKLTEFEASKYLQQLLNAVEYLHELGVIHRDLKPENILLDYKYNVKIIDFGLSDIYTKGQMLMTACGSPCYAPPEMLEMKGYDPLKADIWSLGIILYAMCFGYLPFDHTDSSQLYRIIKKGVYQIPGHASEELTDILSIMLEVNPLKRANINSIRYHKFCTNNVIPVAEGMIQGLSSFPYEEQLQERMKEFGLLTVGLKADIANNKHNDSTATYYLFLQQQLRQNNKTVLNYYLQKNHLVNRYKLIEKVKENYERRLYQKTEMLQRSRKLRSKTMSKKKRSKTTEKKYHTGVGTSSNSKNISKTLFNSQGLFSSPPKQKKSKHQDQNSKSKKKGTVKKLKRT